MGMSAGKFKHRIELQRPVHTQNQETGEVVTTWQKVKTVWAAIEPLSVKEFIQSAATQSEVDTRITIWFRSDVDATWRAVHRTNLFTKIYNIHGALPDKESGYEYLTLPCSSGVSSGE